MKENKEKKMKRKIIMDFFGTSPYVISNEEGQTIYFEDYPEAKRYAEKNLHEGMYTITDVPTNAI
jgi:hypothetical protein